MARFETIEDARETMSYANEDLAEVDALIDNGNKPLALSILTKMTEDVEAAAKAFPEMETELNVIVHDITVRAQKLISKG